MKNDHVIFLFFVLFFQIRNKTIKQPAFYGFLIIHKFHFSAVQIFVWECSFLSYQWKYFLFCFLLMLSKPFLAVILILEIENHLSFIPYTAISAGLQELYKWPTTPEDKNETLSLKVYNTIVHSCQSNKKPKQAHKPANHRSHILYK